MGKSRFEKHCLLCGAKYEYCGNCDRFNHLPRWMETIHNDNCRQIFHAIMDYRTGVKTPKECAEILNNCDLSYRDKIKAKDAKMDAFISAIFADAAEVEMKSENIDVVDDAPTEKTEVDAEPINVEEKVEEKHEDHKVEKKNFNYKKNYKK